LQWQGKISGFYALKEESRSVDVNLLVAKLLCLIGAHRLSARSLEGCAYYFMQEVRITVKAGDALIKRIDKSGITFVAR
jgi:hypothetical protein